MIEPKSFIESLIGHGINFYSGVPDSLLSSICACIADSEKVTHVVAANEGTAVSLAIGSYLSSGNLGAVYLQNSGLGNIVNPIVSLADAQVYKIPLLLIIGWRGEPGIADEPQHVKQGIITESQLDVIGIPYEILDARTDALKLIDSLMDKISSSQTPGAILVRKNTFSSYNAKSKKNQNEVLPSITREDALCCLAGLIDENNLVVSTTGKTSRELFEIRKKEGQKNNDFLTVGGMGHTSSIALGAALSNTSKSVVCIDGDGSMIMHMGSMATIGNTAPNNFTHIIINNNAHDSVGGQTTHAENIDFELLSKAFGYRRFYSFNSTKVLENKWSEIQENDGPLLIEIKVLKGARKDLGRPTCTPLENKKSFMKHAKK